MRKLFPVVILLALIFPFTTQAAGLDSYASIQAKYKSGQKVRILLVPGHDNTFYGTSFDGVKEADLNLELAKVIGGYLSQDPNIEVTMARDDQGYNPVFLTYFNANKDAVMHVLSGQTGMIKQAIADGEIQIAAQVPHADATTTVVQTLYALNSWIDEQNFDLVLHIHFNDYGSRYSDKEGKYSGYSIYVPDQQLLNATTSQSFGDAIGKRLMATLYKSNDPPEKKDADKYGAIPDFYLIAMGAYKTVEAPRALVEYSYIYEPQLQPDFYLLTAGVLGRSTVLGIQDFLSSKKVVTSKNLTYFFQNNLAVSKTASSDVLALQYGLSELGFFPAKGLTRVNCPFSGIFGNCTKKSLMAFQASHGLSQTGGVGPATLKALNKIFNSN